MSLDVEIVANIAEAAVPTLAVLPRDGRVPPEFPVWRVCALKTDLPPDVSVCAKRPACTS